MGKLHEDKVKVKDYNYTLDIDKKTDKLGKPYYVATKRAKWYPIVDYKKYGVPLELENFFEKAILPARNMHNTFHNELYYGARDYRKEVILPQIEKYKNFHMGLGCYINLTHKMSSGIIRTANNVSSQMFSILSVIAFEKFRRIVDNSKYKGKVRFVSSIYDSVYLLVKKEREVVKWVNNTLHPILVQQYIKDQAVPLEAQLEISYSNWASFTKLDIDKLEF